MAVNLRARKFAIPARGFLECQLERRTLCGARNLLPRHTWRDVMHGMMFVLLCAVIFFDEPTFAQPSTAPPTSLPVMPLSPDPVNPSRIESCALCRPLEGRPGSDLHRHRPKRDHKLHPHKKIPGISKSPKRSLKSQLPHHRLEENEEGSDR